MSKRLGALKGFTRAAIVLIAGMSVATPALAEKRFKGNSSRLSQFQRQTQLMDTRLAGQYQRASRINLGGNNLDNVTVVQLQGAIPAYRGKRNSAYIPHARAAARRHGVPEDLFLRLVQQESGWNPSARSHKGATGLAQLMPATAARLGVNPHDPMQNLEGGARYLRQMYNTFGSWRLALAAYNAGPAAVSKYGGIPPYRETTNYVRVINGG